MWLRSMFAATAVIMIPVAGLAEMSTPVPIDQAGRYALERTDTGILRLDRQTGAVSVCTERAEGWACVAAADDREALEGEIARLAAENVELKKRLAEAEGTRPPAATGKSPSEGTPPPGTIPGEKAVDEFMDFAEKMMRRFFDMVDRLKKDREGDRI